MEAAVNSHVDLFFTFTQFKKELGSWEKPLEKFLDSKNFQDIYKFVKEEYESGKKVRKWLIVDLSKKITHF